MMLMRLGVKMNCKRKFSLIIPHYNSSGKIRRLLRSIDIGMSELLEIIIIDDGSEKYHIEKIDELINSEKILDINLIKNHSGNKGAGSARNIGLEVAKGEWVLFADADDYFEPNMSEKLESASKLPVDIVFFFPDTISEISGTVSDRNKVYLDLAKNFNENPTYDNELLLKFKYNVPWGKLIRKSLIIENNVKFDEVMVSNDIMFSAKLAMLAKKVMVIPVYLYVVTLSDETLTTKKNVSNFFTRVDVKKREELFLKNNLSKKDFKKVSEFRILFFLKYGFISGISFYESIKLLFNILSFKIKLKV